MSSNRVLVWTGRLAALVAAVVIPACGSTGSPGGVNPNGILWNSQGNTTNTTGTATIYWKDPNLGVVGPIGIGNIVTSTDDATYGGFFPHGTGLSGIGTVSTQKIVYIALGPHSTHPLSTDSGSTAVTTPEDTLQSNINTYRQRQLGNVGGGGLGGGIAVGNNTGVILSGHFTVTKSARAHCKHYALLEGGFAAGANVEGDDFLTTVVGSEADTAGTPQLEPTITPPVAKRGRLGKLDLVANGGANVTLSGPQYPDANAVMNAMLQNAASRTILLAAWDVFGVGHWPNGPNTKYWEIIFLTGPNPPN